MTSEDRRRFLKLGTGTLAAAGMASMLPPGIASILPPGIRKALEQPTKSGTLADIEHVIILMQENRSFDHYFGMLPGVRGFADPYPAPLPNGKSVWYQPNLQLPLGLAVPTVTSIAAGQFGAYPAVGPSGKHVDVVMPYPLHSADEKAVNYQGVSLCHDWKGSQSTWEHWDAWIKKKGHWSMGYLKPADLPFYYQLADAFTICDAYHCSLFGPTNPNRRFLWTGTSGGGTIANPNWKHYTIENDNAWEGSEVSDVNKDSGTQNGWDWKTYADVLEDNKVSWKVYQGYDNYGDNALAYFNNFRRGGDAEKIRKARSFAGDKGDNAKESIDALIKSLKADVSCEKTFPAVSWIVAPKTYSEHPEAKSSDGEKFTRDVLEAIMSKDEVWQKCAIFITYDENDGYFDHVPAPIPPLSGYGGFYGKHNLYDANDRLISLDDETFKGEPIGLGPRVPMIVVSPFSKGKRVSSRLSDHTSVIRFLETWLVAKGHDADDVRCENISAWRRAVCGDLTETLNFKPLEWVASNSDIKSWVIKEPENGPIDVYAPYPYESGGTFSPGVGVGYRYSCENPYHCNVTASKESRYITLTFDNTQSTAASTFIVYLNALTTAQKVLHYSVAAGTAFEDKRALSAEGSEVQVFGPGSLTRHFWKF